MPEVSIVIRTKDEGKWIGACLEGVFSQEFKDFEVVVIDDNSKDDTLEKASKFDVKLIRYQGEYYPGKALNQVISETTGRLIVCLSGHCVPAHSRWLGNIIFDFSDPNVAGVYGRQEPLPYSADSDKRDLLTIFGLDRKVQQKDSFFHNANSAIRRDLWEKFPFDESTTNIEDRIWAKTVLEHGYVIVYEPEASAYHWHGVHQGGDEGRCQNVVRILESLSLIPKDVPRSLMTSSLNIYAIIPVKGESPMINGNPLLYYTITRALESRLIDRVVVATDCEKTAGYARELGAEAPFLRPADLSHDYVGMAPVVQFAVNELDKIYPSPNIVVLMKETFPFRTPGLLDGLIREMIYQKVDTLMPVHPEFKSCFQKTESGLQWVDVGPVPRKYKEPLYISSTGLGLVLSSSIARQGRLTGDNLGIYPVDEPISHIEVNESLQPKYVSALMSEFWTEQSEQELSQEDSLLQPSHS